MSASVLTRLAIQKNSMNVYYFGLNITLNRGLKLELSNIRFESLKFGFYNYLAKNGPYTNQYLCKNDKARGTSNRACICALYEHDFGFSLSSFDSTYDTNF